MAGQSYFYRGWPAALFCFGIVFLLCYWPGISGAATSPRWALLSVAVVPVLCFSSIRVTMLHVIGVAFLVWVFATCLWSPAPLDTINALWKLTILAYVFCVGSRFEDLNPFYFGASIGIAVSSAICLAQIIGYVPVPDVAPDQAVGLFANRLMMAEASALVGVALIAMREWSVLPFVTPAILLPCERGPILAFALAGAISLWKESKRAACGLAAGGVVVVVLITLGLTFNAPPDPKESQSRIEAAGARLIVWRSILPELSIAGKGFGAFRDVAPQPIEGAIIEHAHNEFLEIAFETGFVGVALLVLFFLYAICSNPLSIEGIVLLALVMESCFAFPLHEPVTGAFGALCAGRCSRALPRAFVPFNLGGKLL
jgi:O-antigen ligase